MANLYCTREAVKRAGNIHGANYDAQIDRLIEDASRSLDLLTRRRFIPETATKLYRWPQRNGGSYVLWLSHDLLSLTTLQSKAQDATPTTIAAADYFLEPQEYGPPYNRIEIDLSSTAAFEPGDTPQRSISVLGSWGYTNATKTAGTVSSGLASSASAVTFVCSNGALIGVGDTLLIESEQLFVSGRAFAALGTILLNDAAVTADMSNVSITVDASHGINQGETIKVDSEEIYVSSVVGNVLSVIRAYNGTVLAAHANDTAVQVERTLTVERGVNGTTAATHADATAVSKYAPPLPIVTLCIGEVLAAYAQEVGHWGRTVGAGEGAAEFSTRALAARRKEVAALYKRGRLGAI